MPVNFWVTAPVKFEADFLQAELLPQSMEPIYDLDYRSNWK